MGYLRLIVYAVFTMVSFGKTRANELDPNGEHVCSVQLSFNEYRQVLTNVYVQTSYKTCTLFSIFGGCAFWSTKTLYRSELRQKYRSVATVRYRRVHQCCAGYSQRGDSCPIPICIIPCVHGVCTAPNNCTCHKGYNGAQCDKDVNECLDNKAGCQQICKNTVGSFMCDCQQGFIISQSSPNQCEDINECGVNKDLCICGDRENNPQCNATCKNNHGSYECQCSEGYHVTGNQICQDMNECITENGNCSTTCINLPGSYKCACNIGYKLSEDNHTCVDINECTTNIGGCQHSCENTDSSFKCSCNEGFFLDGNGLTCSDHDECKNTDHGCEYKCENLQGSFTCVCQEGYKLNGDNKTCSDRNECEIIKILSTGEQITYSGCQHNCHNFEGSFNCSCKPGFNLLSDLKTCQDINECDDPAGNLCEHFCENKQGSYTCRCRKGYKVGEKFNQCVGEACESIPYLENGEATCFNGVTGEKCSFKCHKGFVLQGSKDRWCQPSHKFNGTVAGCFRKQCNKISPVLFGSIALPCLSLFNSSCSMKCLDGYYLDGPNYRRCIVNENDEMFWTNADSTCQETSACHPNPCLHASRCRAVGTNYTCDCKDTGYVGKNCQRGIVSFDQIPILKVGGPSQDFKIYAKPETALTISITSSNDSLEVSINNVTIRHGESFAIFSLQGSMEGAFKLKYILSNIDSTTFDQPEDSVVFVHENISKPVPDIPLKDDGTLKQGCNEFKSEIAIEGKVLSNKPFNAEGSTDGIVQMRTTDGSLLPLSASGGSFSTTGFIPNTLATAIQDNIPSARQNPISENCFSGRNSGSYVENIVRSNAFLYSVQNLFNHYSPYWFKVQVGDVKKFYSRDLSGNLFKGIEMLKKPNYCNKGFMIDPNSTYYVYTTSQPFYILIPTIKILLSANVEKCFMRKLGDNSIYLAYKQLSRDAYKETDYLSAIVNGFLQIQGIPTDRIGFNINNEGKDDSMFTNTGYKFGPIIVGGTQLWRSKNLTNVIKDNRLEMVQNGGTGSFLLQWTILNSIQRIHGSGKLHTANLTYQDDQNQGACENGRHTKIRVTDTSITFTSDIMRVIRFKKESEVNVAVLENITFGETNLLFNSTEQIQGLKSISTEVNKQIIFHQNFQPAAKNTQDMRDNLIKKLHDFQTAITKMENLVTLPTDVSELLLQLTYVRDLQNNVLKRYDVLTKEHVKTDQFDLDKVETMYYTFKFTVDNLNEIGNKVQLNFSKPSRVIELVQFEFEGGLCVSNSYCFDGVQNKITYGGKVSVCNTVHSEVPYNSTILSSNLLKDNHLGGVFRMKSGDVIHTVLPVEREEFKHIFNVTWDHYNETDVKGEVHITSSGNLQINSNVTMWKERANLLVTASLAHLTKQDPVLFKFKGTLKHSSILAKEIENHVKSTLHTMAVSDSRRYEKLQEELNNLQNELSYYANRIEKKNSELRLINETLKAIEVNTTKKEDTVNKLRLKFQEAITEQSQKIRDYHNKCKPSLCLPRCIVGVRKTVCQKTQDFYVIQPECRFKNEERTRISYDQIKILTSYTYINRRIKCFTKCPPLTQFFKDMVSKRKRRSLPNAVAVGVLVKTFHYAGGTEGALGALIGGAVAGPMGSVVGGVIGSVFATCNEQCIEEEVPEVRQRNMTTIERRLVKETFKISVCDNIFKKLHTLQGGSASICTEKTNCSNIITDTKCTTKKIQCDNMARDLGINHTVITSSAAYKSYTRESYQLELIRERRDTLISTYKNLKAEYKWINLTTIALKKTYNVTQKKFQVYNTTHRNTLSLIKKFKDHGSIATVKNISFAYNMVRNRKFPTRILLDIDYTEVNGDKIDTFSTLFDSSRYNSSLADAAEKLLEVLRGRKYQMRRRRTLESTIEMKQLQDKCLKVESSILFLTTFLVAIQNKMFKFQETIDSVGTSKAQFNGLIEKVKADVDISEELNQLNREFDTLTGGFQNWTDVITNFLVDYNNALTNQTDCFSLNDCISYHIETSMNLYIHETSDLAVEIRENLKVWSKVFNRLLKENLSFKEAKALLSDTIPRHAITYFCGEPPLLREKLSGDVHIKEGGQLNISISIQNSLYPTEIEWYKDKDVIPSQYLNTLLVDSVTIEDNGLYHCKATNEFGSVQCGTKRVYVYRVPVISIHPTSVRLYIKSPDKTYLHCNATFSDSITWYFRKFGSTMNTKVKLPFRQSVIKVSSNDNLFQPGLFWCEVSNRMFSEKGPEVKIHRATTTSAVQQLGLSFRVQTSNSKKRKRRGNDHTQRVIQIPSTLTYFDTQNMKRLLANSMNTTEDSIEEVKFTQISNTTGSISFTLKGKDFSIDLLQSKTWDEFSVKITYDRQNQILRSIMLYYAVNKTMGFQMDGVDVIIIPESLETSPLSAKCPVGSVLNSNGFTCGACPPGTQYKGSQCVLCEKGTYQPSEAQNSCIQCPTNHMTLEEGTISEKECFQTTTLPMTTTTTDVTTSKTHSTQSTPSSIISEKDDKKMTIIIIVAVVAGVLVIAGIIIFVACRRRRKNNNGKSKQFQNLTNFGRPNPTFNNDFDDENPYQMVDGSLYSTIPGDKKNSKPSSSRSSKKQEKTNNALRANTNQYESNDPKRPKAFQNKAFRENSVKSNYGGSGLGTFVGDVTEKHVNSDASNNSSYDVLNRDLQKTFSKRPLESESKKRQAYEHLKKSTPEY